MSVRIEFHPRLVEQSVRIAVEAHRERSAFHAEREAIYATTDVEARDRCFARLHADWFRRLGLADPLRAAVEERRAALSVAERVRVESAPSPAHEGAELYVAAPAERTVVLRVLPRTLADPERALELLRHELLHVADMLDPSFCYEPHLAADGPAARNLLRLRYRVLWALSVEGRLQREGRFREDRSDRLREELRYAFGTDACFARAFDGPRPTHVDLLALCAQAAALEPAAPSARVAPVGAEDPLGAILAG